MEINSCTSLYLTIIEFSLLLSTLLDIFNHLSHLLDEVDSAFDLQFLDHFLLIIIRYRCFIQQAGAELSFVSLNEDISTMHAAEQSDYLVKKGVYIILIEALESILHLVVTVKGHIIVRELFLIHEFRERVISCLLELHIIVKALIDHHIDDIFELKQQPCE